MNTRIVNALTGTVAMLTLGIGAGAFVLSYDALYQTGLAYGIPVAKGWIWPLLIDAPLIVFTLALLVSQILRQSAKLWAGLVILYTVATIAFNLSHAQPTPLGWLVAVVAPVGLLLTTEALRHLAKTIIERQAVVESLAELSQQVDTRRNEVDTLAAELEKMTSRIASKQAELDALKADIGLAKSSKITDFASTMQQAKASAIEERRAQVLSLLQTGNSDKDIAAQLGRDIRTIRSDIQALNGKAAEVTL